MHSSFPLLEILKYTWFPAQPHILTSSDPFQIILSSIAWEKWWVIYLEDRIYTIAATLLWQPQSCRKVPVVKICTETNGQTSDNISVVIRPTDRKSYKKNNCNCDSNKMTTEENREQETFWTWKPWFIFTVPFSSVKTNNKLIITTTLWFIMYFIWSWGFSGIFCCC